MLFVPALPAPPTPTLEVSVSPSRAGTEARPRPVKLRLTIDGGATASSVVVYFPRALRLSNSGLPQCSRSDEEILAGACRDAIAGTGTATVASAPERFEITPMVGATDLVFRVAGGDRLVVIHGKLSQASGRYTAKLRIALPDFLRAFDRLSLTMRLRRGANSLFATRGCGLPFRVELRGGTPATLRKSAPCRR